MAGSNCVITVNLYRMGKPKWQRKINRLAKPLALKLIRLARRVRIIIAQKLNMAYVVSRQRAVFLESNFFEFNFREQEPDRTLFDTITDSAELHYLAHIYNWDDGAEVLTWIIDSNHCDQGTAALVFWRSQPDYYTAFSNETEAEWAADVYTLLRRIVYNWESGFYKQKQIAYDPESDPGAPRNLDERNPIEKWAIPAYLKNSTPGKEVFVEE